ncbi:MAG: pilin [Candidatus Saccharimonadales bacterium]
MHRAIVGMLAVFSVLAIGFVGSPNASALPAGCDGTSNTWHNCAHSRTDFEKEVGSWCSLAKTTKLPNSEKTYRQECQEKLGSYVEKSNDAAIKSFLGYTSGIVNPQACYTDWTFDQSQCIAYLKRGNKWYEALKKFIEDCGVAPNQDFACATKVKKDFLHEMGWADAPDNPQNTTTTVGGGTNEAAADTPFMQRIATYLRWIFVGVGVLAVFGFIISGIQYGAAQDNPQSVAAAKTRIINIIYGAVIFAMMFGLLQWLVPGGLF